VWPYERATRIVATELRRRCSDAVRKGNQAATAAALREAATEFRGTPKGKAASADRHGILSAAVLDFERRERGDTSRRITWEAAEVRPLARAYQCKFPSQGGTAAPVPTAGVASHDCENACGFRGSKAECKTHELACPEAKAAKAARTKAAEIKAEMERELDGDGLAELLVAAALGLEPGGNWDMRLPLAWDYSFVLHAEHCNQHPDLALACLYKCLPQAATWDETEDQAKRRLQPIPRERKTACYRRSPNKQRHRRPPYIPHTPHALLPPHTLPSCPSRPPAPSLPVLLPGPLRGATRRR
jgi:hypothetical protein